MTFLILLNIALLNASNTSTRATVNTYISIGNSQVITMPVSDFRLMNSVEDMWTAGLSTLPVLIMVFSGIWHYAKLSMLGSYVMVLIIVAFFIDIPLPIRHPESINDPVKIYLYVYPAYGFVTLMLRTIASVIMSHVVVGVHNVVIHDKQSNHGEDVLK
ncbi:hypothetical protein EHI8A_072120 [Entamoeba histolytica HM-1:IMSS-B]|uniref:Uncharacterized protein n=5 Tax=Entamoeba histolytica TaxID=5759 RepID=B1N3T2_ENTH1|nr:hypothetical protein EHI_111590 [Entamoeba histolytica HM-1:IMSS]EMD49050.1 Hypothetical protein EHI5A_090220 [Entamoeba histolytica KU27]EMH74955.1 hypothetical protein EHI8A_072120 [Entamoeba histolytica HM-1:IMSS-B]ENY64977.1 hypothetical protein EHI7A_070300 [Entamoeba histolytica HM-1:IMSS-A]GAT96554.1 hypothetical protein CL6EHI_111590 [Entamoeba histolytica]EDS89376.1 hypothetical protein EHI_111590 [Entamoeba histolytica HM-1:IMSS]|eukprot:XP_001913848.1 hypothetical protein EHI_111590 [Entamoeba histolytica HM-1:IMSS]